MRWKDINGYEGKYMVSDAGLVKSLSRRVRCRGGYRTTKERQLKGNLGLYPLVRLCSCGVIVSFYIHRLVLEAFVGEWPKGMQCNHKNGVKTDNRLENLEWLTPGENTRHSIDVGLRDFNGAKSTSSKLKREEVRQIRLVYKKNGSLRLKDLAEIFGVSTTTIWNITSGKCWKHE